MSGVTVDEIFQPRNKFDLVLEGLIYALLIFSPLAMGVVEAWSEFVVVCLGAAIALVLTAKFMFDRDAKPVWTWAYVPLGLFILFAVIQIIPMPSNWIALISPNTVALKKELIGDIDPLHTTTISFYPHSTKHDLRLLLVFAAAFAAGTNIVRRRPSLTRFLTVVSTLGIGLAVVGIAQVVTGTEKIFWLITTSTDGVTRGGSFVNRNNFCMWMNLTAGCSLALLFLRLEEGLRGLPKTLASVWTWLTSPNARLIWLLAVGILLQATSVFLSLSRGGVLSLLFAGTAVTLLMAIRRRIQGPAWVMIGLAMAAFSCVLLVGFDAVYGRLTTLADASSYLGRWGIAKGVLMAWTQFPIVGAGLGTHEVVYPMFGRIKSPNLFAYAENEYAQLAEETGLAGLLMFGAAALIVAVAWSRALTGPPHTAALAYGGAFALLATLTHSLGDFGFHLSANHCLVAVLCGAIVGARGPRKLVTGSSTRRPVLQVVIATMVALVHAWSLWSARCAWSAEASMASAVAKQSWMDRHDWNADNERRTDLLASAQAAHQLEPANVHYRYWLALFRLRSMTSGALLNVADLSQAAASRSAVGRIASDLHEARRVCPTYGPAYCVAGQLEWLVLERETGPTLIRKAVTLAPFHPSVCLVAGLLHLTEGRSDAALTQFRRALALDRDLFEPITAALMQAEQPELAIELAGSELDFLVHLEAHPSLAERPASAARALRSRVARLVSQNATNPNLSPELLSRLARFSAKTGDLPQAVTFLRRAIDARYDHIMWRLRLARIYVKLGRRDDAKRQAQVCLRLHPDSTDAAKLLSELSTPR